jgi:RNA polymerase sigma factor (sigma-70 family)
MGGIQETDLLQNTILRLVSNNCAAMKRFSGSTESDLMAYLAVITRSVVRDAARWHRAVKRPDHAAQAIGTDDRPTDLDEVAFTPANTERNLLAREVTELSHRALDESGTSSARDRLIFELYFVHDLSINQISKCKGIELSKAGVEKVLNRIKERVRTAAQRGGSEAIPSYD